jgi:DNA-binding HxlR family transcriptional regulator
MGKRDYGQFCGLARALEIVGERWALLIVRDLLVGPKRFTDLRQGLPRIPTNILSARLKELEDTQVVRRRVLPRPSGAVVYELTEYGHELDGIVVGLGRWGARSLTVPGPTDVITPSSMIMAMRTTFRPEAAKDASYELRLGEIVLHMRVAKGKLAIGEGPMPDAELRIDTGPGIKALMSGEVSPADAIKSGNVRVAGDKRLLARFVDTFRI